MAKDIRNAFEKHVIRTASVSSAEKFFNRYVIHYCSNWTNEALIFLYDNDKLVGHVDFVPDAKISSYYPSAWGEGEGIHLIYRISEFQDIYTMLREEEKPMIIWFSIADGGKPVGAISNAATPGTHVG
jgi:hypothetical protein